MKTIVTSVFVQDQDKALEFYSEKLGFIKKEDVPVGEFRWITLVSPDSQGGTELLLEPNDHPAAKEYQKKIFDDGIPATMFGVADIRKEYKRLVEKALDVQWSRQKWVILQWLSSTILAATLFRLCKDKSVFGLPY